MNSGNVAPSLAGSHQPDWEAELWPECSDDYLGRIPALPDAAHEDFSDAVLDALTKRVLIRGWRVDRFLIDRLKMFIRKVEFDYINDLVIFTVSDTRERVRDTIACDQTRRQNMPGRVVVKCAEKTGAQFYDNGDESRYVTTLYREWCATRMHDL